MNSFSTLIGVVSGLMYGQASLVRYELFAQEATVKTPVFIPTFIRYAGLLISVGLLMYARMIDPFITGTSFLLAFWGMILWGVYSNEN